MTLAVQFTDVSRVFGEVKAVDRVSIDIQDGEFFSMLGPSGSGKTTCLRLIAGFEQPSNGSIRIHGEEAVGLAPYQRDVNTVFQDYALFPHMDVRNNVAYGLKVKGVGKAERLARADAQPVGRAVHLGPGIAGMKHRTQMFNGSLNLRSEPGNGTRIEVRMPAGLA